MAEEHPHQAPSNTDFNITAIFMVCLIGLLLVWSMGVRVPHLWRDAMQAIESDTAIPRDGVALPL
jgi:hypothetical protein